MIFFLQETLIVWSEADQYDLALSFQEKDGCDEIWEKICTVSFLTHSSHKFYLTSEYMIHYERRKKKSLISIVFKQVQGKDPSLDVTQDCIEESEEDRYEEFPDAAPPIEMPPCELSKLDEIAELFRSVLSTPIRKEKLFLALEAEGYIKKLLDLFHMCEDLENIDGLHNLYEIFKSIFLLNKTELFEILFADDTIFDVVGVLEYDPALKTPAHHREYLQKTVRFKEVIPISNRDLLNKIHQTYRVQYIQDVILPTPSVFEENMLSTLTSFVFFNKVEIVGMIQVLCYWKVIFHIGICSVNLWKRNLKCIQVSGIFRIAELKE